MSWVLTIAGFAALILLHEFGHFLAARAVGMRVERFALGIGPLIAKVRRGETDYGIAPFPIGGYVKITGMNPHEELPPEIAARGFFRQPVWKRVVVIAAGPAMNAVVAFLILWGLFWSLGTAIPTNRVAADQPMRPPAAGQLAPGDRLVSVDGRRGGPEAVRRALAQHRCPGRQVDGCAAAEPATVVVERDGHELSLRLRPRYSARAGRPLLGFAFAVRQEPLGPAGAATTSLARMWSFTAQNFAAIARIFQPKQREMLSGPVGISRALNAEVKSGVPQALFLLAIISLALAIVNLFPFLPLDGGHIFWALAEKVRGRAIPFSVMERAMAVGFVLVITLFVIGLTNDLGNLQGPALPQP